MDVVVPCLLFLALLCGEMSAESSEEFGVMSFEQESGEYSGSLMAAAAQKSVSPRLILNPFSVFGNPKCFYNGDEGRCYGEVECLALAGNYGAFCPGLQGLCCLFYRACHQRTSQEVSYFRNLQWPLESPVGGTCAFKVIRRSDDFCGLQVTPEKLELMADSRHCETTEVVIKGAGNRAPLPLCRSAKAMTYNIDFSRVSEVYVEVQSSSRSAAAWNIKLTQVPCSEFSGESVDTASGPVGPPVSSGPVGGSGGSGGGSVFPDIVFPPIFPFLKPTTTRPSTSRPITTNRPPSPQPPAPPPTNGGFRGCGIKGSDRRKRDANIAATPHDTESRSWWTSRKTSASANSVASDRRNQPAVVARDNPFIRDLTFEGPNVEDSHFNYWSGAATNITSRITFGRPAGLREYPWQVAMFVGGRYHCGASVIGDRYVLTAAHCVISYRVNPAPLRLSFGDWDVSNNNDGPYIEGKVEKVTVHESYSRSTLQNDVAVLKLTTPLQYSDRVQPICLPTSDIATDGELQATITGWGRDESKQLKTILQELTSTITTNKLCGERWNKNGAPSSFIVDTMMCMDASDGDSCNGDSGGPAVMQYPEGSQNYVQVGIVSFGSGSCTDKDLPGVYTRVSKYRDWIRQHMN